MTYPIPGVTPSNWGQQLLDEVESRITSTTARLQGTLVREVPSPTASISLFTKAVEQWRVDNETVITLPAEFPVGASQTIYVEYGFQKITWPEGTTIYGSTTSDSHVWLTLLRMTGGWVVLVPDTAPAPASERDTGWLTFVEGVTSAEGVVTFTVGDEFSIAIAAPFAFPGSEFPFQGQIRRIGNRVIMKPPWLILTERAANETHVILRTLPSGLPQLGFGGVDPDSYLLATNGPYNEADGRLTLVYQSPSSISTDVMVESNTAVTEATFMGQVVFEWTTADPWPVLP